MSKYLATDTDITSVANAIRTAGGTSAQLEFPSGFVTAIGNISGGGSSQPVATGTFTGTTAGSKVTINTGYTGSGYLIAVLIYPSVGAYKSGSSIATLAQQYAVVEYIRVKCDISTTPTYNGSGDENKGSYLVTYKNSSSDATAHSSSYGKDGTMYTTSAAGTTAGTVVRVNSNTQISVGIADTSYGFATNIEYTWWAIYSA